MNLNDSDRARLYRLAEEKNFDPVELILKKAKTHDDLKTMVKTYLGIEQDVDLLMVFTAVLKKMRNDNEQLQKLANSVEKNANLLQQFKKEQLCQNQK